MPSKWVSFQSAATVQSTNALSQSESKSFDARFGAVTQLTGPNLLSTNWSYDNFGRKTREQRADGTYTTWAYKLCTDAGANCPGSVGSATMVWVLVEQSYAVNNTVSAPEKRAYYDNLGRVVRSQTQGFDGGANGTAPTLVQDTWYNALGQVQRKSNLYDLSQANPVWSTFSYDALGRVTQESHPDSNATGGNASTSYAYDGLSTSVTNAKGQTSTRLKNAQGQVIRVTDAIGSPITYTYDALGNLVSTFANGATTSLQYNQRGQKIAMQDPAMGAWTYRYNIFGELIGQTDSLGRSSTLQYDALGRMTARLETDLNSYWRYDSYQSGSACASSGRSQGRLCEAWSDNGYNRKHSYDNLQRQTSVATVLDGSPVTVSESFDANTGRVQSKTWPTGYQAFYSYTTLGYLKSVTGGGSNGYSQLMSYTVQAMNAQGQITQYRSGNNVTTVKSFDANTNRLLAQTATLDGQTSGNVLSQQYSYDALGNLSSRSDNSPGVGTQESFNYDAINRLTKAMLLSSAVNPLSTVEVMYDPRGNIAYKSDVGRYWYDSARPNRLVNVTLEAAPGATVGLSGSRALAYAFDDARAAQAINGVLVGNGNLEYTASQDTTQGIHTVRRESYTSFNMPQSISLENLSTNGVVSCPSGYDKTTDAAGTTTCKKDVTNIVGAATASYYCGSLGSLSGTNCTRLMTYAATANYSCDSELQLRQR